MPKPSLQKCSAVVLAALMGQPLHVVTRPAWTSRGVRYIEKKTYHSGTIEALADYRFCQDQEGASYHEYSAAEVLAATL